MPKDRDHVDELLQTISILAFPPTDLPESLSFKSTEKDPVDLDAKIAEYAPYYEYAKTRTETETYDKSGVAKKKIVETLKMKRIDPKPYKKLLARYKN